MKLKQNWYLQIYGGDPLAVLVKRKLKISSWLAIPLIIIILNIAVLFVVIQGNALYNVGNKTGLLLDYGWWIYQFTITPAMFLFYFWLPGGILDVFTGLKNNKIVVAPLTLNGSSSSFDHFIERFVKLYSHWAWVPVSSVVVFIFVMLLTVPEFRHYDVWANVNELIFLTQISVWFILFTIGFLVTIKTLFCIYWVNQIFKKFEINIKFLHHDKSGGLAMLGDFNRQVGYMLAILGVSSGIAVWSHADYITKGVPLSEQLSTVSAIIGYMLLLPVAFSPILTAHNVMQNAKSNLLSKISDRLETDFSKLNELIKGDPKELQNGIEKIEQLQKTHDLVSKFRTWPFKPLNVIGVFSSTLSPILLALLPLLRSVIDAIFK